MNQLIHLNDGIGFQSWPTTCPDAIPGVFHSQHPESKYP